MWEKRQLYLQAALFYQCSGDLEKAKHYQQLAKKEYLDVE